MTDEIEEGPRAESRKGEAKPKAKLTSKPAPASKTAKKPLNKKADKPWEMRDDTLKQGVSFLFVLSGLGLMALGFAQAQRTPKGFLPDEAIDNALFLAPVVAGYATTMVRYVMLDKSGEPRMRRAGYVGMTALLFGAFIFALYYAAFLKAGGTYEFKTYKQLLAGIETIFAAYLGIVMSSLFGADAAPRARAPDGEKAEADVGKGE